VLQRSLYSDIGEQVLAEQETYSDHKVTRGYVYFGNQRVAVVERREALEAAQSATHEGSRGSSPGFPEGKDRWTSYVRDHQGTLLMSLSEYEAQAASWGRVDPRYLDSAGKSRLETTAKLGANQYYVYPYGMLQHKGFLYSQLQGAEYTGKALDEGTQWYYFHARNYDSDYGRFIGHDLVSPDLNNPLTLNPFLYCLNNPGRFVDPDGKNFEEIFKLAWFSDFGRTPEESIAELGHGMEDKALRWHYDRNDRNTISPLFIRDLPNNSFQYPDDMSVFHKIGLGNELNTKHGVMAGKFSSMEFVFDKQGKLVIDPINIGTYNFVTPKGVMSGIGHVLLDVLPYKMFGNTREKDGGWFD
jgi:RHS repeat-associated protein